MSPKAGDPQQFLGMDVVRQFRRSGIRVRGKEDQFCLG